MAPAEKQTDDEDAGNAKSDKRADVGSSSGIAGGIFYGRDLDRTGLARRSASQGDNVEADIDDDGEWHQNDGKRKQVFKGRALLWLAYQSIGVIYGDIGTSPLYVYSSVFTSPPSKKDITQVLSLIIWSLAIMVTFKYVFIILRADNEGEGGTFSTYSLLTRYMNISNRDPREEVTVRMERTLTQDVRPMSRNIRKVVESSTIIRNFLKVLGALGVAMVIADGVLTPAQSVLGAIQGLAVVKPDIDTSTIVGTTCGILVLLFLIQPLGTTKLASAFAPIVILWLGFNGGFGIYNLVKYDYTVLKAFNPYFAIQFFKDNKTDGWRMLGGMRPSFFFFAFLVMCSGMLGFQRCSRTCEASLTTLLPRCSGGQAEEPNRSDWFSHAQPLLWLL
ncbi:hypothetical protein BN1723_011627 [Verticillium longisporum]|uniref:K+ potassium transporter integral membrane domain-containing protein n=1 Tax=Verticillium longisporum TaxID=100787 RepID=A0A0G4L983_VERLO|nr:hypothetical protein BN1723_011627 [Verticillium longisporum]